MASLFIGAIKSWASRLAHGFKQQDSSYDKAHSQMDDADEDRDSDDDL